jgi:hypothetical protein
MSWSLYVSFVVLLLIAAVFLDNHSDPSSDVPDLNLRLVLNMAVLGK